MRAFDLVGLVGLVALLTLGACSRHATPEECQQILDRYVDFTIDGDPSLKGIPEETRGAVRDVKKQDKRTSPEYLRARTQCDRPARSAAPFVRGRPTPVVDTPGARD